MDRQKDIKIINGKQEETVTNELYDLDQKL